MAGATIDHIVSIIIFLAALVLFINLFSQTVQTAIIYEQHRATATKCSDLIDNILLNPGSPSSWGQTDGVPTEFGLQDPEFTQYQLSAFSAMRVSSPSGDQVYYKQPNQTYSGTVASLTNNLFIPTSQTVDYHTVLQLLGINNTYGFQLNIEPLVTVSVNETQAANPLKLELTVSGTGFPLANATINYCLIQVGLPATGADYPSYTMQNGEKQADEAGMVQVQIPSITTSSQCYAFVAYAYLGGLLGVGYHERVSSTTEYVVPLIQDIQSQQVLLANSFDLNNSGPAGESLKYNATFALLTDDYQLRELPLNESNNLSEVGTVTSGVGNPDVTLTLPPNVGILIVTYSDGPSSGGIALMPWGVSSLGYPISFGGSSQTQMWVTSDVRQVTINDVSYQATLDLWSSTGQQVNS